MGRSIFISYRRDDSEGEAGRLFDDLTRAFGEQAAFMDVDGISPGMDFRKAIDENVSGCGVLLAIIGPTWTAVRNSDGSRRLDNPDDFVRLEIASALRRDIAVIPVLVHDARMPHANELPENLKDLAYRNSVEITHARWNSDVQLLMKALERYVSPGGATDHQPVHATVPVQLPPPAGSPQPATGPRRGRAIAIIAPILVLLAAAGSWLAWRATQSGSKSSVTQPATATSLPNPVNPSAIPIAQTGPGGSSAPGQVQSLGQQSTFAGTWLNTAPEANNGLAKLQISDSPDHPVVHAWGKCVPMQCDWSTKTGDVSNGQLTATFLLDTKKDQGNPDRTIVLEMRRDGDRLQVHTINNVPPHRNFQRQFEFERAQEQPVAQ